MSDIQRLDTNKRLSRVVIHNGVVHVAGVTSSDLTEDIGVQTRDVLNKIDGYLASAGTDKSRLLTVQIWLKNIDRDFEGMNAVWGEWADMANMPTRATGEVKLARADLLVEIIVSAAK